MKADECPQIGDAAGFAQGGMEPAARAVFERHLAECGACRQAVEETGRVVALLQSVPPARVSRDLAPEVLARIRAEPAPERAAWVGGLAAAAGLVLLLGGLWWYVAAGKPQAAGSDPVASATAWLCATQEPDGSWSTTRWGGRPQFEVALTGLSLMALLQGDRTDPRIQASVDKAVNYLMACQDEQGRLGPVLDAELYNQGIATLALARAYQFRRTDVLRGVLDRALGRIQDRQHGDGGWGYENTADTAANLSITLWQVEALRLAGQLGWDSAASRAGRGLKWMTLMVAGNGSFGYRQQGDATGTNQTLTAMGAMSLIEGAPAALLNPAVSRSVRQEVIRVASAPGPDMDYYRRYFLTAALKKMGEDTAAQRLSFIRRQLATRQVVAGSEQGSWPADDQWSAAGGRVYATAMASLSLR